MHTQVINDASIISQTMEPLLIQTTIPEPAIK
jgi:hypothetical protein